MTPRHPLGVVFYRSASGHEPVRVWLRALTKMEKRRIGEDIKTVLDGKFARVLFTLEEQTIVLLHGFIKKGGQTPKDDLVLARQRMRNVKGG